MPKKKKTEEENAIGIVENIAEAVIEGEKAIEEVVEKIEEEIEKPKKKKEKVEKTIDEKKKELLEKVAKLKEKVDSEKVSSEALKEEVEQVKKKKEMLIPLEEYVKSGIYIGTKVVTPQMRQFVYRRRADGLAIFNTDIIDERLREGIAYLSKFDAKDIIVVCKREAGWKAVKKFAEITGIRAFCKKYPAGIITNTSLPTFFENELTIIVDSWVDKNALNDTMNVNKKVLMICDTNNFVTGASQIIIGNNKSPKSLGVMFYLLTKGYCKAKGIEAEIPDLEWWMESDENYSY